MSYNILTAQRGIWFWQCWHNMIQTISSNKPYIDSIRQRVFIEYVRVRVRVRVDHFLQELTSVSFCPIAPQMKERCLNCATSTIYPLSRYISIRHYSLYHMKTSPRQALFCNKYIIIPDNTSLLPHCTDNYKQPMNLFP